MTSFWEKFYFQIDKKSQYLFLWQSTTSENNFKIPCNTLKNNFSGNFKSFATCLQKFEGNECQK